MGSSQISVVMPVRNGRTYIAEALRSALDQDGHVSEILVIDDGSSDGTCEEVLAVGDPRIRLSYSPGRGVSDARNGGIGLARSAWVLFLDADDRLAPRALTSLLAAARPQSIAVYGDYDRINAAGHRIGLRHLIRRRKKPSGDVLDAIVGTNFISVGCAIVRRDALHTIAGFDRTLNLCEDWLLWCRLATLGPIHYVPLLHVFDYRIHNASTMHRRARPFADIAPVIDRIFADPLILARLDPARVRRRRAQAEESLRSYVTMEAVRLGAWTLAGNELADSIWRSPCSLPRLTFRLAASMAGL